MPCDRCEMEYINRILELAESIQQIPAPTFFEQRRAEFIRSAFIAEGLQDVSTDDISNVYARLPGVSPDKSAVVSAHMDTVFPMGTDLTITHTPEHLSGPGIGDNSLGVAGLFGLVWSLRQQGVHLPGDLWLVANVCEEGLGDLKGMRAVVNRFGAEPLAYLVLEGMAYGRIYHQGLGVRRYRITTRTQGGHSWVDYGRPSAIHELSALITKLAAIKLPKKPRTTFNVGTIQGGISVNTIASQASVEVDLRSSDEMQLTWLEETVNRYVTAAVRRGVKFQMDLIGNRPSGVISRQHPLVKLAVKTLKEQGIETECIVGSTDANIPLSRGLVSICIGLTRGGAAHTMDEFITTNTLEKGMTQLVNVVRGIYDEL